MLGLNSQKHMSKRTQNVRNLYGRFWSLLPAPGHGTCYFPEMASTTVDLATYSHDRPSTSANHTQTIIRSGDHTPSSIYGFNNTD